MQLATLLYNDRVVTYKQMKQLDEQLDRKPTRRDIMQMVELRIRNLQAFDELQSFNDTGRFRYRHPLVSHKSEQAELERLLADDPAAFMQRYKNCTDNIRRYTSYLRRPDRSDRRTSDRRLLQKYTELSSLFQTLLRKARGK